MKDLYDFISFWLDYLASWINDWAIWFDKQARKCAPHDEHETGYNKDVPIFGRDQAD